MQWAEFQSSRKFFDLFLRLIDDGTLDSTRGPIAINSTFWSMLYGLAQARPAWIAEVIAHWLRRRRQLLTNAAGADGKIAWRDLFGHDQFGGQHFHESAKADPENLVQYVLPVVLEISDAAQYEGDHKLPKRDAVWPLFFNSQYESISDACLSSLISALTTIGQRTPGNLQEIVSDLKRRDTYVSNTLLLNIYASAPKSSADDAAATLVAEPRRFQSGFSDTPYWTSMRVIERISPHLTPKRRSELENAILNFTSDYELSTEGHQLRGRSSFSLLSAIPREFRSSSAQSRYQELERKFRRPDTAPEGIRGGTVVSPIKRSSAEKMSDEQWVKAIEKYHSEHGHSSEDFLKGGAWELAGMFRDFVRDEPERFAKLCLTLPTTINPVYLQRALDGLKEASVNAELKFRLCRKAFAEHKIECSTAIADLLGSIKEPIPADQIETLGWIATEHPEPEKELWNEKAAEGTSYYGGDVLTHGINTTRGRAAEAIRDLVLGDSSYIQSFDAALHKLVLDDSLAVRACVASTLIAVARTNWPLAQKLFITLICPRQRWLAAWQVLSRVLPPIPGVRHVVRWFDRLFVNLSATDDRLLATHYVNHFVYCGLRNYFRELRRLVERMLRSKIPDLRDAGAILASLAAIYGKTEALVAEAMTGDASQRLGVAKGAAANVADPALRSWCEKYLCELFNDDDAEVRRQAAFCFRTLKDEQFDQFADLICAFINSKAYETESTPILFALEQSTQKLPGVTAGVCEKFLSRFGAEARDVRTSRSADAHMVAKLIFRTYHQHESDAWGSKCLDLIDQMCLEGIHEVSTSLAEFDR